MVRALELRCRELELQGQQARESEMRRQHELSLKLIESMGSREGGHEGPTLSELIMGVRSLRDLSGNKVEFGCAVVSTWNLLLPIAFHWL